MSILKREKMELTTINEIHCDGPKHDGDTYMMCDTITVEHGYGSPHDTETQNFCSMTCARDWFAEPVHTSSSIGQHLSEERASLSNIAYLEK